MAEIVSLIIEFLKEYGIHSMLCLSILANLILAVAWIKREKYIELTQLTLAKPFFKFELNKDKKYREMADKLILLETENKVLKKEANQPYLAIIIILIVFTISVSVNNTKNKIKDIFNANENNDDEEEKLDLNQDPFLAPEKSEVSKEQDSL